MKCRKSILAFLILVSLLLIPVSFASDVDLNQDNIGNSILNAQAGELENSVEGIDSSESVLGSSLDGNNDLGSNLQDNNDLYSEEGTRLPDLDTGFTRFDVKLNDSNTIYVNSSYTGSKENGTKANPYKSLKSGFDSLSDYSNDKSVLFIANGVYKLDSQIKFYSNRNGIKNYTIIGQSASKTIINCNKNNLYLNGVSSSVKAVSIFNLTFTNGSYNTGGAIYSKYTYLNLINTIFKNNCAKDLSDEDTGSGGAIYNDKGYLRIYNSNFINNSVSGQYNKSNYGGAIYNNLGELSIFNSKFVNNSITGKYGSGGAIYNYNGYLTVFKTSILNSTIYSTISMGGAITNWNARNTYIINSTISGNVLNGSYTFASAIVNKGILLEIVNSTISNNNAKGISSENSTVWNINGLYNYSNSIFKNNKINKTNSSLLFCMEDQLVVSSFIGSDYDDGFVDYELLANLPSYYDLRDYDLVTSVKDQGTSGSCWAFATYAALESFLLKYENASYDFSENNMKNSMGIDGLNGTDWDDGGNYLLSLAYLLRGSGPVNESQDPFVASSTVSNENLNISKYVTDALFVPLRLGYLDNDQIKYAIMKYGAVFTSLYSGGMKIYPSYYNYYPENSGHAVAIIGWDDSYSASHFSKTPPGDGAFIVKNSWGENSGKRGYWYISYYDPIFAGAFETISAMAFTNVENLSEYKNIYQYDILGNTFESIGYNCETAWFANQFTADSNTPLKAFGFYTYGPSSYLVNITVNGVSKLVQEGKIASAGYHTIKLDNFIHLLKGDVFRIAIRLTTPNTFFPIAIESKRSEYSSKAIAGANQSFISQDGKNWYDISKNTVVVKLYDYAFRINLKQTNVCLKAYTGYADELYLNVKSNSSLYLIGDLIEFNVTISNKGDPSQKINVSSILDKSVSIVSYSASKGSFNNSTKIWTINNLNKGQSGTLNLVLRFNEAKKSITASFKVNSLAYSFNQNLSKSVKVSFASHTEFLDISNITTKVRSGDSVAISLIDAYKKPLAKNITVSLLSSSNNCSFSPVNINLKNGSGIFNLSLLAGNYKFMALFEGGGYYDPSNATFYVKVVKTATQVIASDLNATTVVVSVDGRVGKYLVMALKDADGNPLSGRTVQFNISGSVYNRATNESGLAALQINRANAGTCPVKISFSGDEEFGSSSKTVNVYVQKQKVDLKVPNQSYKLSNQYKYISATLVNSKGKALSGKKLTITINGKTYTATTNSNGLMKIKVSLTSRKTYSFRVKFLADQSYSFGSRSAKVVVY